MRKKLLIALSLIVVLGIGGLWLTHDGPPPDDEDMRLVRLDIPDEENAFTYFRLAGDALYWPGPTAEDRIHNILAGEDWDAEPEAEAQEDKIYIILYGKEWDAELVERVLAENKEMFKHRDKGLACSQMQVPKARYDGDSNYFIPWREVGRVSRLKSLRFAKSGEYDAAFDAAIKTIRFGHMVQGCRGSLIYYIYGATLKSMCLGSIRDMLPEATQSAQELSAMARALKNYRTKENDLAHMLRAEYESVSQFIDDFASGEGAARGYPLLESRIESLSWFSRGCFFLPNETKRLALEEYRSFIADLAKRRESLAPEMAIDLDDFLPVFYLARNGMGKELCKRMLPSSEKLFTLRWRSDVSLTATRLLIALKRYKMQTGKLPATLDALVPQYIDAIPADDFDGKPMRYSPEKKLIWSVGENLEDDGGDIAKDIIFEIEF